jgi:hypothetical protein
MTVCPTGDTAVVFLFRLTSLLCMVIRRRLVDQPHGAGERVVASGRDSGREGLN